MLVIVHKLEKRAQVTQFCILRTRGQSRLSSHIQPSFDVTALEVCPPTYVSPGEQTVPRIAKLVGQAGQVFGGQMWLPAPPAILRVGAQLLSQPGRKLIIVRQAPVSYTHLTLPTSDLV